MVTTFLVSNNMRKSAFVILVTLIVVISCQKNVSLPGKYTATPYELKVPKGFPTPVIPVENPMTVEGVNLGHMLYFDPILSSNGKSCNTCHTKEWSFSSPLFVSKTGIKTSVPPHLNLAWNPEYNWDGSAPKLDLLPLADFGPDFFNTNMSDLVQKIKSHPKYPFMFKQAFNVDDVAKLSSDELQLKIVYALSQFMRTMISSNSKCDKMFRREVNFTPEELDGFQTFSTERGDCFHCHGYPLFSNNSFNNNGLDSVHLGADVGLFAVTKNEYDKGKFSAPTLRNIELTAPYMHDGRFQTLEEVVEFYNSGVHWNSPNIDPLMTKSAKIYGLNLSTTQKANLVKFLKTLTDTTYLNNPEFANPL